MSTHKENALTHQIRALAVVVSLLAFPAPAQTAAPEPPPPTRAFGGCNAKGSICLGPSIAITTHAWDLTNKQVLPAFSPGLGYGVTFNQGKWSAWGFDAYLSLQAGNVNGMTAAGMFKFANGYGRIGLARMIAGGRAAWLLPIGIGFDL